MFAIGAQNLPPLNQIPGAPADIPADVPTAAPTQYTPLSFDTLTEGMLTAATPTIVYRVDLPSAGRLTMSLSRTAQGALPNNGADVRWRDANGVQMTSNLWGTGAFSRFMDLEAGTYFIEVARRGNSTGSYFITASFFPANNNEIEPNNSIHQAHTLTFDQMVTGFISHQDPVDIYRVVLPSAGRLTMNLSRTAQGALPNWGVDVRWRDANGIQMRSDGWGTGAFSRFMDLEAGTYFIEVARRGSDTGSYFITASFFAANNNEIEPNNNIQQAQQLASGQSVTGFISHQDRVDIYRVVLPTASRLTVNISRPAQGALPSFAVDVRWRDTNGIQLRSDSWGSGAFSRFMDLPAGAHFIEIAGRGGIDQTGSYILTVTFP